MLRSVKKIIGFKVFSDRQEAGRVEDVLVDEEKWVIRYLVVTVGSLFNRRKLLVSPWAVAYVDGEYERVSLTLKRDQLEACPPLASESDAPVSRHMERRYFDAFSWPYYWGGPYFWGASDAPGLLSMNMPSVQQLVESADSRRESHGDPFLRNSRELIGYGVESYDGDSLGQVEDFVFDDRNWVIRAFAVHDRAAGDAENAQLLPVESVGKVDWIGQSLRIRGKESLMGRETLIPSFEAMPMAVSLGRVSS